jgi:hypothetical protein
VWVTPALTCAAPKCDNPLTGRRRRFCSDKCSRKGRRAERIVENPDFGKAAVRMIRAMARRTGASDAATFALLWQMQNETADAVVEAIDLLRGQGFSWADLGAEIGVTRNAVSQWHKRHTGKDDPEALRTDP